MVLWTSLLALAVSLVDDPGVWSLGAIAISTISLPGLFLYHTEEFWHRLASAAKDAGSSSRAVASRNTTAPKTGKVADSVPVVAAPVNTQAVKLGFRSGLPKIVPGRRSSAAEKLRSRSKRGKQVIEVEKTDDA
ncbi:unnamed protein product [Phytophthora fragariaefolia]|uniref:Unnamed protein product n=1 Tax=Phytophthora fragariaefolia TaxID=1490495 RepID=A0A9W7D4V1_9STRA|nr:unnamed protein product [Phytophthora fragariaefolia]